MNLFIGLLVLSVWAMFLGCSTENKQSHAVGDVNHVMDLKQRGVEKVNFAKTTLLPENKVSESSGGIFLSFDDSFVRSWGEARDLFKEYNARVTFFVTRPHKLEPDEVEILQNLQNDGHEITCHGLNHKNLRDMMEDDNMTLDEVIASEITPAIDALANHGFSPVSFAYPFGGYNDKLVDGLGELFPLQRKSGSLRYKKLLEPNMLYSFVKGSSIDYKNVPDFDDIEDALEEAYDQDKWIVFYTHKILHSGSPSPSQPYIKVKTLKKILKKANDLGMPFHTMNRLASSPKDGLIYKFLSKGEKRIADQMLDGKWEISAGRYPENPVIYLGPPQNWTWDFDPQKDKMWRYLFYSLRPLSNPLSQYVETKNIAYLSLIKDVIESYVNHAPSSPRQDYIYDKHGTAFRAMILSHIYTTFEKMGVLSPRLADQIKEIVRLDKDFLKKDDSFESDHNHGITEAAALILLAHVFPQFSEDGAILTLGLERLKEVVRNTVAEDGVQVEQSPFYHFYTMNFLWQIQDWNLRNQVWPVENFDLSEVLNKMFYFSSQVVLPNGILPPMGASQATDIRSWTIAKDLYPDIGKIHPQFAFMFSNGQLGVPPTQSVLLQPSGWAFLRSKYPENQGYRYVSNIIFDVGPYRTKHSDLDALSLNLWGLDEFLLSDSGLYSYEKTHKEFYKSTKAHNTIVIDQKNQREGSIDQSDPSLGVVNSGLSKFNLDWNYQSAWHTLYEGFKHKRGILMLHNYLVLVIDEVENNLDQNSHSFEQLWHTFPTSKVTDDGVQKWISDGDGLPILSIRQANIGERELIFQMFEGSSNPRMGWISEKANIQIKRPSLIYKQIGKTAQFATLFCINYDRICERINQFNVQKSETHWNIEVAQQNGLQFKITISKLGSGHENGEFIDVIYVQDKLRLQ